MLRVSRPSYDYSAWKFCRHDNSTAETPTCCNFYQDQYIQWDLAKFMPLECLLKYPFYREILSNFICITCEYGDSVPDFVYHRRDSGGNIIGTDLYICDLYAKQLYAPGQDPQTVDLT